MPDEKLEMTLLYDFYGELLTDKQREYFDLHHNEDLSLSEIAQNVGITRQGVHDIITRAEETLRTIERKTGLIRRFTELQAGLDEALALTESLRGGAVTDPSKTGASELIELLNTLKG